MNYTSTDFPTIQGWNNHLRNMARDESYKRMWMDIYRHRMRYDAAAVQHEMKLEASDVSAIQQYYGQLEQCEMPMKFVTVNYKDGAFNDYIKLIMKCLTKCYVGEWQLAFEQAEDPHSGHIHPHFHIIFKSTVPWLAKSRIIREWSNTLHILPQFIDVKETSEPHKSRILNYMSKEQFQKMNSKDLTYTQYARWNQSSSSKIVKKTHAKSSQSRSAPKASGHDSDEGSGD